MGIEKPVIQGPMVYLTDAKLVAAVSNAGGMGSLGPHAGQVDSTKDPAERAERLRAQIRQVKELTDEPFSVNVLPSQHHEDNDLFTPPQLEVVFEEEVPAVTFVGEPNTSCVWIEGYLCTRVCSADRFGVNSGFGQPQVANSDLCVRARSGPHAQR